MQIHINIHLWTNKGWVTYRFLNAVCHNDANNMTLPPTSYHIDHFQNFNKIDNFLKNVSNVLNSKTIRLHLWITAYFIYSCLLAFFLFCCGFQEKQEPRWRNYLILSADWSWEHNTSDTQNTLIFFYQKL